MARCDMSVEIGAPVEVVWNLVQNATRRTEWDYRITGARLLNSGQPGMGVRMRSEGRFLGRPFGAEIEYVAFEPLKRTAIKILRSWGMAVSGGGGSWKFEDLSDGRSRFQTTVQMHPLPGMAGKLVDRLITEPALRFATARSLAKLKTVAEADSKRTPGRE